MKLNLILLILTFSCSYSQADEYISKNLSEYEKGKWSVTEWANEADEEYILSTNLVLPALKPFTKTKKLSKTKPELQITCRRNNQVNITIIWAVMLDKNKKLINSIYDDGSTSKDMWVDNKSEAHFYATLTGNKAITIINKLLKTKQYKVTTTYWEPVFNKDVLVTVNDNIASMVFDVRGIKTAIKPIISKCSL